jgi:hypothetical protein
VIAYVRCRGDVAEAVLMSSLRLDRQRWHCRAGGPLPAPTPRARRSSGTVIAFDCRQHRVDGLRVAFGRRRCQGGVALAALMARASTDGLSIVARAAPCLPHARVVPLAPQSCLVAAVTDEAVSMARALTGCVCVVARAGVIFLRER